MFIIGITGLSCSGKTTVSEKLKHFLGENECLLMSMDDYYKELTPEQYKVLYDDQAEINFDQPDAINFELLVNHLNDIKTDKPVDLPKFDLGSCVVTSHLHVEPFKYKYIILEGVFIFSDEKLKKLIDLKIWVEASEYVCALRRFIKYTRDIEGYTPDFVYNQCIKHVIPGKNISVYFLD